jgi:uncharacterized protein
MNMKTAIKSSPIISFIVLTFLITFGFWFLPVIFKIPTEFAFATFLMGGCGPLLSGYFVTVINSDAKIRIHSKAIFLIVFILSSAVISLRMYLINHGLKDNNGNIPVFQDVSIAGFIAIAAAMFIIALNASNATNSALRENYLKSFLPEKGKLKWYLIGFFILIFLTLTSYSLGKLFGVPTSDFMINFKPVMLIGFFSTFFFFGANEEFGWRGFLQKELQKNYNPLLTTLAISFLWSLWHLPLHYNGFYSTGGFIDLLPRFLYTIPLTIIFTWLYNRSSYSVLAVVILHATTNSVGLVFGVSMYFLLALLIIICTILVIDDKMWKKKQYPLNPEKAEPVNREAVLI